MFAPVPFRNRFLFRFQHWTFYRLFLGVLFWPWRLFLFVNRGVLRYFVGVLAVDLAVKALAYVPFWIRLMLSLRVVEEVEVLLAQGLSHRAIAVCLGVSRGSVCRVSVGRLRSAEVRRRLERSLFEDGFEFPGFDESLPRRRCVRCGAVVFQPCLACWLGDRPCALPLSH